LTTRKALPVKKAARKAAPRKRTATSKAVAPRRMPGAEKSVVSVPPVVLAEKQKLVRDSFTMPKREYEALSALKLRLMTLSHSIKKGELLRAGVSALTTMSDSQLIATIGRVPRLKTGRPKALKPAPKKSLKKKG
jgi:hypothetical protein